jgi:hypothetical protein
LQADDFWQPSDREENKEMPILSYHLTLNPVVFSHSGIRETTFGTFLPPFVKRIMAASPTSDVGFFPREVTHRGGAFSHYNSPRKF